MIIDVHTHIYPDKIASRAVSTLEKRAHVTAKTNGMRDGLLASMKEAGVDYSLLLPVATSEKQVDTINEEAARTNAAASETGLLSFGAVHPETSNYKQVLRQVKSSGLKGIKLHPDYQSAFFNDIRYKRIVAEATELGLFMLVHAGEDIGLPDPIHCRPEHIIDVVKETQSDKLILAHMGGWRLWDEIEVNAQLLELPLYYDTAFSEDYIKEAHGMLSPEKFVKLVRIIGADRVLFGTDSPWSDQKEAVEWINKTTLNEKEKQFIFHENFERIIGV